MHWRPNEESNSIAVIVQHLGGNMHSRWIGFARISYHLGQTVFLGKQIKGKEWTVLGIPKNGLREFAKTLAGQSDKH